MVRRRRKVRGVRKEFHMTRKEREEEMINAVVMISCIVITMIIFAIDFTYTGYKEHDKYHSMCFHEHSSYAEYLNYHYGSGK